MRILAVSTFMSLDGVVQSPGGPDEDPTGGFEFGGWGVNYFDDEMMRQVAESAPYELLLGRGTYEIFAAHWPTARGPIADQLNGTRKHVASTTLRQVDWNNSTLITGDVADYVGQAQGQRTGPRSRCTGARPDPDTAGARPDRPVPTVDLPARARHEEALLRGGHDPGRPQARRQQGLGERRHHQHVRARGGHQPRLIRSSTSRPRRSWRAAAAWRRPSSISTRQEGGRRKPLVTGGTYSV